MGEQGIPFDQLQLIEAKKQKKKRRKKMLLLLLNIVVGFAVIAAGFFIWYSSTHKNDGKKDPDAQVAPVLSFLESELSLKLEESWNVYNLMDIKNINKEEISFNSSNEEVAKIVGEDLVTFGYGIAVIKATYRDVTTEIKIIVSDNLYAYSIDIKNGPYYIYVGETQDIDYIYAPANASEVDFRWKSSNDSVVSVKDGKITGMKLGKAAVTLINNNSGCNTSDDVLCETEVSTEVYVVGYKISYEVLRSGEYQAVRELVDTRAQTSIKYDIRVKITGIKKPVYDPQTLTFDIKNIGGSDVTINSSTGEAGCDDCYLYTIEYTFNKDRSGPQNSSTVTFKLPNGSLGMLTLSTKIGN